MNNITACAVYKGDSKSEKGLRLLDFEIPSNSERPPIPVHLIPSFAAKKTDDLGAIELGETVFINGRIYLHDDHKAYIVPSSPLQKVPAGTICNQIDLAGIAHLWQREQSNPNVFSFGMMCRVVSQKPLGHREYGTTTVGFRIESWGENAANLKSAIHKGCFIAIGGSLKFDKYINKEGVEITGYRITVRSKQFTIDQRKAEKLNEVKDLVAKNDIGGDPPIASFDKKEIFDPPHQQAIAKPSEPVDDGIPF
tara:strand:+ start:4855 stop:5610 length:756 start_codon:yes stop_codon:yes gene_type:complete